MFVQCEELGLSQRPINRQLVGLGIHWWESQQQNALLIMENCFYDSVEATVTLLPSDFATRRYEEFMGWG